MEDAASSDGAKVAADLPVEEVDGAVLPGEGDAPEPISGSVIAVLGRAIAGAPYPEASLREDALGAGPGMAAGSLAAVAGRDNGAGA